MNIILKIKVQRCKILHFKAFGMINLQEFGKKFLVKPQMTKTSQDNNLNDINFWEDFHEYLTEKLKYRDVTCLILKVLPCWL
jgi:hypothetical protein